MSDQPSFINIMASSSQKNINNIEKKLYSQGSSSKNFQQQTPCKKPVQRQTKQGCNEKDIKANISSNKNFQSIKKAEIQRPDLINIGKTQQMRQKQFILKKSIQSTIQQLLSVYKNKNKTISLQQQQTIKDQVFQRFAFIFSQMNQLKGDIENTINFLNHGENSSNLDNQNIGNDKQNIYQGKIQERSQSYEQQSIREQNEQNEQKNGDEPLSAHGNNSLEQRFQEKIQQNSMQLQKQ